MLVGLHPNSIKANVYSLIYSLTHSVVLLHCGRPTVPQGSGSVFSLPSENADPGNVSFPNVPAGIMVGTKGTTCGEREN